MAIFDISLEIYHRICFWAYAIPYVRRSEYIRLDRIRLSYLTPWDKLNCAYCGYANGLMRYAARIAGETEKYWCSIKHRPGGAFRTPEHHKSFMEYGDERAYREIRGE